MFNLYINDAKDSIIEVFGGDFVPCIGAFKKLEPNTVEASFEKHIPVVSRDNDTLTIKVGSVEHPMTAEHYIKYIFVVYDGYVIRRELKPLDKPKLTVNVNKDIENVEVYAYCNLHGLWKIDKVD